MSGEGFREIESGLRAAIRDALHQDERSCLAERLNQARLNAVQEHAIQTVARDWILAVRERGEQQSGLDGFLREYDLSSQEGILLMCIAEALLRIPDSGTADRLIEDQLSKGKWAEHLGNSASIRVNASSWALLLTGRLLSTNETPKAEPEHVLHQLLKRIGQPLLRVTMRQAMQLLARHFVLGRDIDEALQFSHVASGKVSFSYDCLGEAARTRGDVEHYLNAYRAAIAQISQDVDPASSLYERPGISIKLSALHPRYEYAQRERVHRELVPRLGLLVHAAAQAGIIVTLDAEEAERLELSLDIFVSLVELCRQHSWQGLGLAVQAYQKRALPVLHWLRAVAEHYQRRIPLRLVKGAYWDSEIKRAQQLGLDAYPVFTRKAATDVSYLACVRYLFQYPGAFLSAICQPQRPDPVMGDGARHRCGFRAAAAARNG
jgi:RHH-type proline utilization regulon transcriptional repressor/proline dehydrogenase/delta 1-pyrroline-5-carboxylate dehydrogenase